MSIRKFNIYTRIRLKNTYMWINDMNCLTNKSPDLWGVKINYLLAINDIQFNLTYLSPMNMQYEELVFKFRPQDQFHVALAFGINQLVLDNVSNLFGLIILVWWSYAVKVGYISWSYWFRQTASGPYLVKVC